MISGLYIGTTAASLLIDLIAYNRLNKKIENAGYKKTKNKKTFKENFISIGKYTLCHLFPILNVAYSLYVVRTLNDQEKFEEFLDYSKNNGSIEKIKENKDGTPYRETVNIEIDKPLFETQELGKRIPQNISKPKIKIRKR